MDINKKINISNKIYPIFYGLSADLVFFVAINTIFLTKVKHLTAMDISSLTMFSMLFVILIQNIAIKIIKKIGNKASLKLGVYMMLLSSILITFSKSYILILLGYILYSAAPLFKEMDSVILRENLKAQNRLDKFIKIQNSSTLIYSAVTMVISFVSGFLFNINPYIPMLICIAFCINNCILSNFIYEIKQDKKEEVENKDFKFTKRILIILLVYSIVYSIIELSQTNTKLLLQYNLEDFLKLDKAVIYLSFIIALSRIARVLGNLLFIKVCKKIGKETPRVIITSLIFALFLILLGDFIKKDFIGIIIMTLGFLIILSLRDPLQNYMRTVLLNKCRPIYHEQAVIYFNTFRKIGNFVISGIITLILLKFKLEYVILFLLIGAVISVTLIRKMYNLVK